MANDPILAPDAVKGQSYAGRTLGGEASDADGDPILYVKMDGAAWLLVATNGDLSGTPTNEDVGLNVFTIRAIDRVIFARSRLRSFSKPG